MPAIPGATSGGNLGLAVALTVLAFVGVLVLVAVVVIVVLFTMGNQFANLLSNVTIALSTPSP